MNNQQTQDLFTIIQHFAALCNTEGIEEATKVLANEQIRKAITLLSPEIDKLSLANKGILV